MSSVQLSVKTKRKVIKRLGQDFARNKYVYLMVIPVLVFYILFKYGPMTKMIIAFQDYNLYKGITDVAADEAKPAITYDQTTITPAENRIFKTVKDEPNEWLTDDSKQDLSIYENWVISVDGDCENPVEMTLPEMEEQFFPNEHWFIDAIHEKLMPLPGYTPKSNFTREEELRIERLGL